jgi:Domain of unknown function (DUF4214)
VPPFRGRIASPYVPCLEPLEGRSLPSTAQYVSALYNVILHRDPQPSEAQGWVAAVNAGVSPMQVALAFTNSPEYRENLVRSDYQTLLGRDPSPGEVSGWVGSLQAGRSELQLEAAFLGSEEYYGNHGASPEGWLTGVYQDALGRAPDAGGLSSWGRQLRSTPRDVVALGIVQSTEALAGVVAHAYADVLGRAPDADGGASRLAELQRGVPLSRVLAELASSPEFIGRVAEGVLDVPPPPVVPVAVAEPVPVVGVDPYATDYGYGYDPFGYDTGGYDPFGYGDGYDVAGFNDCGCDSGFDGGDF